MSKPESFTLYDAEGDSFTLDISKNFVYLDGHAFEKKQAGEIRDWLTEWLDYDPDRELVEMMWRELSPYKHGTENHLKKGLRSILNLVREHDARKE